MLSLGTQTSRKATNKSEEVNIWRDNYLNYFFFFFSATILAFLSGEKAVRNVSEAGYSKVGERVKGKECREGR